MIADSPDEVRVRVREQLFLGATQIKLTAGGGVASPNSPLDASTFTEAELRAAVEAAESWGTYVTVHAYTPVSIQRAIAAGVKCIEHGHLMDEPTARLIAEKGIWLSTQAFPDEMAERFRRARKSDPRRSKYSLGPTGRSSWQKNTRSKSHLAPIFCSLRGWRSAKVNCWPSSPVGTHPPKRLPWRLGRTPSCSRCRASAIPIQAARRGRARRAR